MNYNYSGIGLVQATWDTVIQPYIKSSQVFICPSDFVSQRVTHPVYGKNMTRSYTVTTQVFGNYIDGEAPLSLSSILSPSLTVAATERDQPDILDMWGRYSRVDNLGSEVTFRHLEIANFLNCDGHVKIQAGKIGGPYPNFSAYSLTGTSANSSYGAPNERDP